MLHPSGRTILGQKLWPNMSTCAMDNVLDAAVARCPFLHRVASESGVDVAKAIALKPCVPAEQTIRSPRRPLLEELDDYSTSFRLWHGTEHGVVPLLRTSSTSSAAATQGQLLVCPRTAACVPAVEVAAPKRCPRATTAAGKPAPASAAATRPLPLATMSMSFGGSNNMFDFGGLFRALQQKAQSHSRNHKSHGGPKPPQPQQAGASSGGTCPMRKLLGPLAPMVFNPKGHLQCPEAIVRARAALAATKPVRELRPQALPIKLAAVAATTAAVNVPLGAAREHTEKFSFAWFVAVHASIPFIAMLRKAVIMPKYAIVFTIAAAIAGQAMGARMERQRLLALTAGTPQSAAMVVKQSEVSMEPAGKRLSQQRGSPSARGRSTQVQLLPAAGAGSLGQHHSIDGDAEGEDWAGLRLLWGTGPLAAVGATFGRIASPNSHAALGGMLPAPPSISVR